MTEPLIDAIRCPDCDKTVPLNQWIPHDLDEDDEKLECPLCQARIVVPTTFRCSGCGEDFGHNSENALRHKDLTGHEIEERPRFLPEDNLAG